MRLFIVVAAVMAITVGAATEAHAAPAWAPEQQLASMDGTAGDSLGQSVAVMTTTTDATAIVGAPYATGGGGAGAAYIFVRAGTTWSQQAKLAPSDIVANDTFGRAVSIGGDTAVVGAPAHAGRGAVWVFRRTGSSWGFETKLVPTGTATSVGASVANDGDTLVVGAPAGAGAAYVFVRGTTSWAPLGALPAPAPVGTSDALGRSVAIRGDLAVVGAPGRGQGAAFVFVRSGTTWSFKTTLTGDDAASGDQFGASVALDGAAGAETIVVGAPKHGPGAAYVFGRSGDSFMQQAKLAGTTAVSGDSFGETVRIANDRIAASAPFHEGTKGMVFVFRREGTSWKEEASLVGKDSVANDRFGTGVGLSGGTLVVGAPTHAILTGAAYVFRLGIPLGEACTDAATCVTGICVDGICCDRVCDGACEACTAAKRGVGTGDGTCGPVAAGHPSPTGACGGCVDAKIGTCDGKGACNAAPTACAGNLACASSTACRDTCTTDGHCASGYRCNAGKCEPVQATCSPDGHQSIGADGTKTECGLFVCGSTGACLTTCTGSSNCITGAVCDSSTSTCVAAPAATSDDDGGCAFAPSTRSGAASLFALLALGALRRRVRR